MTTQNATTTNLSDFCARELNILIELLQAWRDQGLPDDFCHDNVHPMFNMNSGHVFLTNDDYQVCMLNGDKLEMWYSCPNCGHEGFLEDCKLSDDGCNQCLQK
jgi:hypothetical protein